MVASCLVLAARARSRRRLRRSVSLATVALTLGLVGAAAATVNHPFGTHTFSYTAGTIHPGQSQPILDQAVRDFYDVWKERYVREACGPGRWVVLTGVRRGNLTVSEGHGYGLRCQR